MSSLFEKKCIPCRGGTPHLVLEQIQQYLSQVEGWNLEEQEGHHQIIKEHKFRDFKEALTFVNKVGEIAEQEGHHPNIYLYSYNKVRLTLYTHAIGGLHENDFIFAAKVDALSK